VRGTVTYAAATVFSARRCGGLMVRAPGAEPVPPGTVVEALGFPAMGRFSALLDDAVWKTIATETGAGSSSIQPEKVLTGAHDADLIAVEADVVEVVRAPEEVTLWLRAGAVLFPARLAPAGETRAWRAAVLLR